MAKVRMKDLLPVVAEHFGVSPDEILGRSRLKKHSVPRMAFCWLCRLKLEKTYPQIGRFLERDHTSIIHAVRVSRERKYVDWDTADDLIKKAEGSIECLTMQ